MNDKFDEFAKNMNRSITRAGVVLAIAGALAGLTAARAATLTVLNTLDKGAGSLRDTINNAKSGDTIVFDSSLWGGTITLASDQLSITNNLDIEGPGAGLLTVSGDDNNRVFDIADQATVTIAGLTITHGLARSNGADRGAGGGGGILNAGNLTVANAVLSYNRASPHGGAIANAPFGVLTVAKSAFIGNRAVSKDSPLTEGGAVWNSNRGSIATIIGCSFITNRVFGANGGVLYSGLIGQGNGGAIHNGLTSVLIVRDSTFIGNQALGGNGGTAVTGASGSSGSTVGGAISNDENCDGGGLVVNGCTFAYNMAIGGSNNSGGSSGPAVGSGGGGAIYQGGVATIADSIFIGNQARGGDHNTAGSGVVQVGLGGGGAIKNNFFGFCAVNLAVSGCAFTNNQAVGGLGNSGGIFVGAGIGGVLDNFQGVTATFTNSTLIGNKAIGGAGGAGDNGGDALGGGLANLFGSTLTVGNCALTGNQVVGGAGGTGGNGGNGFGGGVLSGGLSTFPGHAGIPASLELLGASITLNTATGGAAGMGGSSGLGVGGGSYLASGGTACLDALTTVIANSASTSNDDVFGVFSPCP